MTLLHFGIDVELDDVKAVATAAFELGTSLAKVPGVELAAIDTAESIGARRDGVILAIVISFATALAAPAAHQVLKETLSHSKVQFSLRIETDYPPKNSVMEKPLKPTVAPPQPKKGALAKPATRGSPRRPKSREP